MNTLNTTSVGFAVTPTVVSTLFSHYFNRKPLRQRPTAHLSYDEGLHLIRSFLEYASHHTVEELQAFTAQWVPHPQWVKVEDVTIAEAQLTSAAELLHKQLGPDGLKQVGGEKWWQWRKPDRTLDAEWIEMRSDAYERKQTGGNSRRVMMYIHGGAYYFGSVDEHRYQMQRHARKLKARVFAPKYRLSPQFPFPCGLHDCLATYLYLLTVQDPTTIVLAGDSAGGGMVMSLLCVLRDQGIPLPAGAILISPWVDLTHSFPSVAGEAPLDYIPQAGFHHKPSKAWPPPNEDDIAMLREEALKKKKSSTKKSPGKHELKEKQQAPVVKKEASDASSRSEWINGGVAINPEKLLSVSIDGQLVKLKDQIQMYTTNELLAHPLVSPVMQPTLGGLPPLLIMVGGGEILRDEQIYMAHKCANPAKYAPPEEALTPEGKALLERYKPTDVQLQVWDDLCHVAPTLSFTRPAKYMYRSVAQFGAWVLARAQKRGIEILDDDDISVISESGSDSDSKEKPPKTPETDKSDLVLEPGYVGKAGDPLPPFKNHMIRQRVTRHGATMPLAPETELVACCVEPASVGVVKEGTVKKWLAMKNDWDHRYASAKAKVHKKMVSDMAVGYHSYGPGECPPPTALAGRRRVDSKLVEGSKKQQKSWGLAMWSLWGSKHDEMTVEREKKAASQPETRVATNADGEGARSFADIERQDRPPLNSNRSRSRSHRRTVTDENQTGSQFFTQDMPVAHLIEQRKEQEAARPSLLSPDFAPETGVAGKRPFLDGIALPFSLNKDAETASMMTLQSNATPFPGSRPMSPNFLDDDSTQPSQSTQLTSQDAPTIEIAGKRPFLDGTAVPFSLKKEADTASMKTLLSNITAMPGSRPMSPSIQRSDPTEEFQENGVTNEKSHVDEESSGLIATPLERPGLDTFVTAQENLPLAK
ncbi:Ff.00g049090.m01.CDS01 [Fusarium sp. VM40]|nr:Ff.00g049090.m01.CDS01 [Fusarium sp. VM40]